ncbi:sushi, von Willebrand factor type A, EGF and pentraxin domain-containing protein 1-like isoform X2 [Halichondria panicea]|uniref:sushi, von Willebrand factor type A, EGF and pentraxin domain-containing protein 1-like isoform X2 n=1 Tax=Halichondria panicea TaxID=6063 RepID=UPI00312B8A74
MMTATYTCNTGYNIAGSNTRTCGATALWTPDAPTCAPVDCGSLTVPINGQVSTSSGTTFMSTATYTCNTGYTLNGVLTRTCQANGNWDLTVPTCDLVDCGPLTAPFNGAVNTSSGTTFMMTATYTCNTYNGSTTRTCGATGIWSGSEPTSTIYLTLGSTLYNTNNIEILITDIGQDDLGARGGLPYLTCHTDLTTCCRNVADNGGNGPLGQWTYLNGSEVLNNKDSTTAGQQFYRLRNEPQLIRLNRRQNVNPLTPTGSYCCTVPTTGGSMTLCANLVVCPSLPPLMDGVISYSDSTLGENTVATHTCEAGSALTTDLATRTCGVTSSGVGDWSGSPLVCAGTACPDPTDLQNGWISYSTVSANSYRRVTTVATYFRSCTVGLETGGTSVRTCSGGVWIGSEQPCIASNTTCSHHLTAPTNGMIGYNAETMDPRPVNTVATYTCITGYTVTGSNTRTCGSDGMWSGSKPTCTIVTCPTLTNIAVNVPSNNFGSTATYTCNTGYTINGDTTRMCQADGTWSGTEPTCQLICPNLPVPTNGAVMYSDTTMPRAVDSMATYTCNPGYQVTGLMVRTCTVSGWSTGDDPVCIAICPDLTLTNGAISYSPATSPILERTTATHSCTTTGYQLSSSTTTKTCQSDRMWSGVTLTCNPVPCGNPPTVINSGRTFTGTTFGAMATYSCNTGYQRSGSATITCQANGSWSAAPVCTVVDCGSLSAPTNGGVMTTGTTYQSTATYSCDNGYTRSGDQTRVCQASGDWNGSEPACNLVDCGALTVTNGTVDTSSGTTFMMTATYTCNNGYTLTGDTTRMCGAGGSWTLMEPTCVVVDCGPLTDPSNGMAVNTPTTTFESTATYSCNTGYTLTGNMTRTCQAKGDWSGSAPTCDIVACPALSDPNNGMVDVPNNTFMSNATYACVHGHNLTGGSTTRTCGSDGVWSGSDPTCTPVDCGSLSDPSNGAVDTSSGTTFMRTATYTCNTGYTLTGSNTRTCQADTDWSGSEPACDIVTCPALSDPTNGMVDVPSNNFGSIATYTCNRGHNLTGDATRTCEATGMWSGSVACNLINCGDLTGPDNGLVTIRIGNFGSNASYTCETGYMLNGDMTRMCQDNGDWSGTAPTCDTVDCSDLTDPTDGAVNTSSGTTFNMNATYSCNTGYNLNGTNARTCQADRMWSGNEPACDIVTCPALSDPNNGMVDVPNNNFGTVANYTCNTGYMLTGDVIRVCEVTGDWSGTTSTCDIITCPTLSDPTNGTVDVPSNNFESTATYACDTGYNLTGGSSTRICGSDGVWSDSDPTCTPLDCGSLSDPSNGAVDTSSGTTFMMTATYTCNTGYTLTGSNTRTCQADTDWSGSEPACDIVTCPALSDPTNGMVDVPSNNFGSIATYTCNRGHNLTGDATRTCEATGMWSGRVACNLINCGDLTGPDNGLVTIRIGNFGSNASYTCETGYMLNGDMTRMCQDNGDWSGSAPTCDTVDCGDLTDPTDGAVNTSSGTTFNMNATYSCNTGYNLNGTNARTCQADRMWSGSEPSCDIVTCPALSDPHNGMVDVPNNNFGTVANYTCNTGYMLTGDVIRVCEVNGDWSGTASTCDIITCPTLSDPTNGTVDVPSNNLESIATYACDTGYNLTGGSSTRTCGSDGVWSGSDPTCTPLDCGSLSDPSNGAVDTSSGTTFMMTATYTCNTGYTLTGSKTRTCQADTDWSGSEPACDIVTCPALSDPTNGMVDVPSNNFMSNATYTCVRGHNLTGGSSTRTCGSDGVWSGSDPTCTSVDCGSLSDPSNGAVPTSSGTTFMMTVTYSCNTGYTLTGSNTRTCQADTDWSGSEPACDIVTCPALSDPTNGMVDVPSNNFGSIATYTCNRGHNLTGDATRTCEATGMWSGSVACNLINCGDLTGPDNGLVTIRIGNFGSNASYTCETGYMLNGDMTRMCQDNGDWSGSAPTCDTVDCGDLTDPTDGAVNTSSGTTFNMNATYSCNTGYNLNGTNTRTCQADRMWSGNEPACDIVTCSALSDPTNGMVSVPNNNFGTVANYMCNTGYMLTGDVIRVCEVNGDWSGTASTCDIVTCPTLTDPTNGIVDVPSNNLESTATYACDTGYNLTGGISIRTCGSDGVWSGSDPTCTSVDCGSLYAPSNGAVDTSSGTTFMMTATYTCNTGYTLTGSNTRTCGANGGWTPNPPICDPVDCGPLTDPSNGMVDVTTTTFGSTATYTCNTGYMLTGDTTRTCGAGGQWSSSAPTCNPVDCGAPPTISDGSRTLAGTTFGETTTYTCTTSGFSISGSATITCQANGSWEPEPACTMDPIDCGTPPPVSNGSPGAPSPDTMLNGVVTYTCVSGYEVSPGVTTAMATCMASGAWGPLPTCAGVSCGDPLPGNNASPGTPDPDTLYQGLVLYTCNTGYWISRGAFSRFASCRADRTWGPLPTCQLVDCGSPPSIGNGSPGTPTRTTYQGTVTYTCVSGYEISKGAMATCMASGTWGPLPTCSLIDCGAPPTISDGSTTLAGTTFGEMATYTCTSGFSISGSATITCQANGGWEPEPACTMDPIDCGTPLSVSNGSPGTPSNTMLNGVVTYTCVTGYEVSNGVTTAMATCMASGMWETVPTCSPVNCGSPPSGTNASPGTPTSTTLGGTVTYTCDPGYWISRGDITTTATCMASGVWETLPTCSRIVCEAERDSVWWLFVPATLAGTSYTQQCPQNGTGTTLGTATRFCTLGGVWEAVITDNCTREVIISLSNMANELFSRNASQNNASQNEVDNLLVSLTEATSVNATGDSTIFPQDLSTTNTIVKSSVNYLVQNVEIASPVSSLNFSEEVMNIFNNVLDERNIGGWERLQENSAAESQQLLLSAELYGQYVSLALRSEAVDTGNMTEITLVRQNIVLSAMEVDPTNLDDIIFPKVVKVSEETGSAQSTISAALLAERGSQEGNVTAVNILFSNLEDFLPNTNLEMNTTRPVTQVISSQVFSNVKLNNSQTRATFRFTTQKFSEDEVVENARCVFWSVSSDAANSTWSKEGVTTVSVDEDKQMRVYNIVCESSHFTAFAVLVDVTGALNDTTPEIRFALSVVTYAGCSISIFFLFFSIFYFLSLRKELLTKVHYFIHLNLSISLLLGYLVFLTGVETAVANKVACVFVAALLHYLFTTVFFWMLCEGIMLYLMLVVVFNRISKKWWIFFIIGWVVPVIPVAISAGIIHDQYGTEEYCWIAVGGGDKGAIWAFVVPMLLVVLANIFFLLAALRSVYNLKKSTMQQTGKKESLQLFSQLFKASVILLPLLGLTWVFGLLSVNSSTIVFAWLFSIFNSLQGLFVFIFHVLRSEKVTNFLKQCRKSVASTSTSGKYNTSNPTSVFQLRKVSMQDEVIKDDEIASA